MVITRQQFMAYEKVRQSGITNMFDIKTVMALSGLGKEEVLAIMDRYSEYKQGFNIQDEPEKPKKQYSVIYEVVKQYRVIVEADNEEQVYDKFHNCDYDANTKVDMEDLAPYEDYDTRKVVEVEEIKN